MSVQKYRLERGWSQEQLAQHSGLSVRTIQRIERGKTASLETLKCLAAVFETRIADLAEEPEMEKTAEPDRTFTTARENDAIEYVKNLKGLYVHMILFAVIMPCLAGLNYFLSPDALWVHYVAIPWGLAIALQALITYGFFNFLGPKWEQRQFRKRMKD
ncbi:helix-turn-helix domain-containing protein [Hyphococcus flavus]|uniref:Helix-turn-helix domain-containing protein n=1 Tax=Hyphococcus flavus TaxID=1866326 RepID=A0AAE9ZDZ6_9PROT|nr:helix-turn-helix domain-containing protein [Hyphococcus flavus]WDI30782.1 helix-turn-helix domain-containing protein [Hyphococcus flavus]